MGEAVVGLPGHVLVCVCVWDSTPTEFWANLGFLLQFTKMDSD